MKLKRSSQVARVLVVSGWLVIAGCLALFRPLQGAHAQEPPSAEQIAPMEERLRSYPVFYNFAIPHVQEMFTSGQALGNRANVFTTVGDSNTTNGDFMRPIGLERNFCELGPYTHLQETIDYFSVSPREGQRNSFTNDSAAAELGFSSAIVLDPFWADARLCENNESPLMCEYRLTKPAVSIIMLGQIDINYGQLTADEYRANMEEIIQESIAQGVIPVITTIVFLPSRDVYGLSLEYNMALLDLVEAYQVPLINLWAAVQGMPNVGIGPDQSHLSTRVGSFCSFDGPEQTLGGVLRNLLTLQALDELRLDVLAPAAP